jgi:hypothetical protein
MTFDTVAGATPARKATVLIVGRRETSQSRSFDGFM